MALTDFQRRVCRLIARNRIASGESYVAGAAALNELIRAPRISRDVDLFHDTEEALEATWQADRRLLEEQGFQVNVIRERPSFVEAQLTLGSESLRLQWTRDSAYRFFPLVQHEDLGLVLHPLDLATNKVLALVGRLEVRDWIDVIECNAKVQPLGYLAWAACGKDPGFGPGAILEQAGRSARYSREEVMALSYAGAPPDPGELSQRWHAILETGKAIIDLLPPDQVGKCVISAQGSLYVGGPSEVASALEHGHVDFHPGSIRGAFPQVSGSR